MIEFMASGDTPNRALYCDDCKQYSDGADLRAMRQRERERELGLLPEPEEMFLEKEEVFGTEAQTLSQHLAQQLVDVRTELLQSVTRGLQSMVTRNPAPFTTVHVPYQAKTISIQYGVTDLNQTQQFYAVGDVVMINGDGYAITEITMIQNMGTYYLMEAKLVPNTSMPSILFDYIADNDITDPVVAPPQAATGKKPPMVVDDWRGKGKQRSRRTK